MQITEESDTAGMEVRGSARPAEGRLQGHAVLLTPIADVVDPEVSVVIPAMNEELTVGLFVDWCLEGLRRAGIDGEVLIVDSSTDRTAEIAVDHGARALRVPARGLGRAYIDALPYIRGRYVVMGDADCTYDFRDLRQFTDAFRQGSEFVMGSRWKGSIEAGSMPWHHRYVGTPGTTRMLNVIFGSHFSDIHCGMRGISRDALLRMELQSQSWEYASEMVLKSVHMGLRTTEVPVHFLKDRDGRVSHHRRLGWFSPFQAAWINLRAMFVYGAEFFLYRPGIALLALGLAITLPLVPGPLELGRVHPSLGTMLLGVTIALVGLQSFFLGCVVQVIHEYDGRARRRWLRIFPYTRTVFGAAIAFVAGLVPVVILAVRFWSAGALGDDVYSHTAVLGLFLILAGFMTFTFTLLLHLVALRHRPVNGQQ